jgi:uncharacterized phage protein gp47/JayE
MPLESSGYVPRLVDEVLEDIEDYQRANIDPDLDQQAEEPLGQINGLFAAAIADLDAAILAVWRAAYPESAEGESLDAICALHGVTRLAARPSTVVLTLTGTAATLVPAGRVVTSPTTGVSFTTLDDATIGGGGTITVDAECTVDGPTVANAGTLTQIDTPVAGWASVTNAADAVLGTNKETTAALRIRRKQMLFAAGNATVNAIRDSVLRVDGVTACNVFENVTESTVDGVPPKSIEVVAIGGDAQDVRDAILATKAAGIRAYGTATEDPPQEATDDQGFVHEIKFSRPSNKAIKVNVVVKKDPLTYPSDGDDQIEDALLDLVNALGMGVTVRYAKFFDVIFNIDGVLDVPTLQIGYVGSAFGTSNLTITPREIANLQAADCAVSSSV